MPQSPEEPENHPPGHPVQGAGVEVGSDITYGATRESQAGEPDSSPLPMENSAVTLAKQPGILSGRELPPGGMAEGFVFFQLDQTVVDWRTVRLTPP